MTDNGTTASLPMYDRRELQASNRQYWQWLRASIIASGMQAPVQLSDTVPDTHYWLRADLCLSQTCGLPYRRYLHGKVSYVGTPDFNVEGCAPGYYRSVIVVRRDDKRCEFRDFSLSEVCLACNSLDSQSGFAAIAAHDEGSLIEHAHISITGSHAASAIAVATGTADIAAIDYNSWRFMLRYDTIVKNLRVLALTRPSPALPYISALSVDGGKMYTAIKHAVDTMPRHLQQLLGIRQLVWIDPAHYLNA